MREEGQRTSDALLTSPCVPKRSASSSRAWQAVLGLPDVQRSSVARCVQPELVPSQTQRVDRVQSRRVRHMRDCLGNVVPRAVQLLKCNINDFCHKGPPAAADDGGRRERRRSHCSTTCRHSAVILARPRSASTHYVGSTSCGLRGPEAWRHSAATAASLSAAIGRPSAAGTDPAAHGDATEQVAACQPEGDQTLGACGVVGCRGTNRGYVHVHA
jgi:hypothetical protein